MKISGNWKKFIFDDDSIQAFVKISLLLLLCMAAFIMDISMHSKLIQQSKEDAQEYEDSFTKMEGDKKVERRDEKKVGETIKKLKNKNSEKYKKFDIDDTISDSKLDKENKKKMEKEFTKKQNHIYLN